jgi:hypothetical protein
MKDEQEDLTLSSPSYSISSDCSRLIRSRLPPSFLLVSNADPGSGDSCRLLGSALISAAVLNSFENGRMDGCGVYAYKNEDERMSKLL